jgi:hypothetical protein
MPLATVVTREATGVPIAAANEAGFIDARPESDVAERIVR